MFTDRAQAGRELARALERRPWDSPIVLALPRGGVPIGRAVAEALGADLDVLIVRKLGVPTNPEFAFGAIGEGGVVVIDQLVVAQFGLDRQAIEAVSREEGREINRRIQAYRAGRPLTSVTGRTVIVVDDGLATGATAEAGVRVLRQFGAASIVVAVPTGSQQAVRRLDSLCDGVVCLEIPAFFGSVGAQYEVFAQVSDRDVLQCLGLT